MTEETFQSYPVRWYILVLYSLFACLQVGQCRLGQTSKRLLGLYLQHVGSHRPERQDGLLLE